MIINEQFRKCVVFLYVRNGDISGEKGVAPVATGFCVGAPIAEGFLHGYVVTARHVVYAARPHGGLLVRINRKDGSSKDVPIPDEGWFMHPTTDVALARIPNIIDTDLILIQRDMFATAHAVAENGITIGDETFFVGLFSPDPGTSKTEPIVRFGNISRMPTSPVSIKLDPASKATAVEAYLVEARSWGGHSGSPAFVYLSPDREPGTIRIGGTATLLLGLVSGHYEIPQPVRLSSGGFAADVSLNAGIAMVIPAAEIDALLDEEELVMERRAAVSDLGPVH